MIATSNASEILIEPEGIQPRHAMMLVGEEKILLKALDSRTWVSDGIDSTATLQSSGNRETNRITYVVQFATDDELRDFATSILRDADSMKFASIQRQALDKFDECSSLAVPSSMARELDVLEFVDRDDPNFVDAQLARLLGRPKYSLEERHPTRVSNEANDTESEFVPEDLPSTFPSPVATAAFDTSYLSAEPKHKQNKIAVSEQMKSFRAVAEMSVRADLAKHSWNKLTNDLYFTSILTLVATIATTWNFGTLVFGGAAHWSTGILCAVATFFSAQRMRQILDQLNQWRLKNTTQSIACDGSKAPISAVAMDWCCRELVLDRVKESWKRIVCDVARFVSETKILGIFKQWNRWQWKKPTQFVADNAVQASTPTSTIMTSVPESGVIQDVDHQ